MLLLLPVLSASVPQIQHSAVSCSILPFHILLPSDMCLVHACNTVQGGVPWGLTATQAGAELDEEEQAVMQKAREQHEAGGLKHLLSASHDVTEQADDMHMTGTPAGVMKQLPFSSHNSDNQAADKHMTRPPAGVVGQAPFVSHSNDEQAADKHVIGTSSGVLEQPPAATYIAKQQTANERKTGTPATASTSNSAEPQGLAGSSGQMNSTVSTDSTSVPDRATSAELASAEDPTPYVDERQQAAGLPTVAENSGNGSWHAREKVSPRQQEPKLELHANSPSRPAMPDVTEGNKLRKKPRQKALLQCISCGSVQHATA